MGYLDIKLKRFRFCADSKRLTMSDVGIRHPFIMNGCDKKIVLDQHFPDIKNGTQKRTCFGEHTTE